MVKVCLQTLFAMKLSIAIITSIALISSTVTALALPNEQDLVTRDNEIEARVPLNFECFAKCFIRYPVDECRKKCA